MSYLRFSLLFSLCITSDSTKSTTELQTESMVRLVNHGIGGKEILVANSLQRLKLIKCGARDEVIRDPCRWDRVTCTDGVIREINWSRTQYTSSFIRQNIDLIYIEWIPSTVFIFEFAGHEKEGILDTRLLPRDLVDIDVRSNRFFGTLNLSCLPARLRRADFRMNCFSGSVSLEHTPPELEALLAKGNNFSAIIVDNSTITQGDCFFSFGREVPEGGVQIPVVEKNNGVPDERIRMESVSKYDRQYRG